MDETSRYSRNFGVLFASGWLIFLVIDAGLELTGPHTPVHKLLTLTAATVFVGLYLAFWLNVYHWRWVNTAVLLGALCAIATALALADFDNWGGVFIYCGVAAGFAFYWRRAMVAIAAMAGLAAVLGLVTRANPLAVTIAVAITLLAGVGMVSVNRLIVAYRELRSAREDMAQLAVAEERLRFARDLHDLLGHSLSVIVLKSELAGKLLETAPERASREVRDMERVARDALREVREAVSGYRQAGLAQELEGARRALKAAGVAVQVQQRAEPLPAPVDSVLAWAVREATTNVIRHSRARRVSITLESEDGRARLEVADDGVGGEPGQNGIGLRGLRERVESRDGTVEVGPAAQGGFRVAVSLPLTRTPVAAAAET